MVNGYRKCRVIACNVECGDKINWKRYSLIRWCKVTLDQIERIAHSIEH